MAVVVAVGTLALAARGLSLACAEPIINNESNLHVFGKVSYDPRELLALYPRGSAMKTPWSGGDWAAARDSINFRWAGATTLSPVEKYALAFGQNAKKLADAVSLKTGASKNTNAQSCSQTKDCTRNSEVCAKRRGEATGFCLPDWDGISFGWSQASMLEPEPRCVAIKNGVVFEADDVKALAAQFYELNPMATIQIGRRYDGPTTQSYKAGVDPYGRFNDDSRRDVNAGAFHIAVSNLLGYHGAKIFLDVDSDEPRRLRPLLSFEVLQMKKVNYWMFPKTVDGVTSDEYMSPPRSYYFNPRGVIELMHAIINITWVEPTLGNAPRTTRSKTYEYFLELDYEGKIVGGEWLGDSNQDHPDFLAWRTTSFPDPNRVSSDGLSYSNINELITLSAECDTASETAPPPKTSSPPTPTTTKPPPMTPAPTQTLCPGTGQMSPRVVTLMASTKSPETDLWIVSPDCSVRTDTLRAVTGLDTTGTPPPFRTTREPIRQLALLTRKPVIVPPRTYLYIADDSIERVDSLPAATEHMMIKNPSTFLEGANFSSARKLVDV